MVSFKAIFFMGLLSFAAAGYRHKLVNPAQIPQQYAQQPLVRQQVAVQEAPVEELEEEPKVPLRLIPARPVQVSRSRDSPYTKEDYERIAEDQNMNAKYSFATAYDDSIMDGSQIRQETRDGLKVQGTYSYSDGFFKRTVEYTADENGYRVDKETVEPIGDGPVVDLVNGKADVHTHVEGVDTQYSISAQEMAQLQHRDRKIHQAPLSKSVASSHSLDSY